MQQQSLQCQFMPGNPAVIQAADLPKNFPQGKVGRVLGLNHPRQGHFMAGKGVQVFGGANIRGISPKEIHMEHIRFRQEPTAFRGRSCMEGKRHNKNQVLRPNPIFFQFNIVSSLPFGNQGKFRFFVPVGSQYRVLRGQGGNVFLDREKGFPVLGVFFLF